jgi:hypothetical protein
MPTIPRFLLDQVATVRRYTVTRDAKNFPVRALASAAVYPGRLELNAGVTGSVEDTMRRDTVISTKLLFLPPTADVRADDEVTVAGIVYQVDGEPDRLRAFGTVHHIQVQLRITRDAEDA